MADTIDDLEQQIRSQVTTLRPERPERRARTPEPSPDSKSHVLMDACQRAADMVRGLYASHEAEGETLAKHLEQIGETFNKMCHEAAKQVRDLRIMPKQMAEDTATDLLTLGQQEEQRHAAVTKGLLTAREALNGIQTLSGIKKQE